LLPAAATVEAQGRGRDRRDVARAQGIPPGQLPPADRCRVWYDGVPPGRQPGSTSCAQAERIAARDRNARVIYGEDAYDRYGSSRNGVYRSSPYPYPENERGVRVPGGNRAPYDPYYTGGSRIGDTAYENGYRDGRTKGLEDRRDNDRFDPSRHSWYRSSDRGYITSYGDKTRYRTIYRDGFQAGYERAYYDYSARR
jgi:hypothetical protein